MLSICPFTALQLYPHTSPHVFLQYLMYCPLDETTPSLPGVVLTPSLTMRMCGVMLSLSGIFGSDVFHQPLYERVSDFEYSGVCKGAEGILNTTNRARTILWTQSKQR